MPWVSVDRWEEPEHSLGWVIADWAEAYLTVPGGTFYGQPLQLSGWQLRAMADWYAVDQQGRWLFRRGQVRLAKKTGKALALDTPVPTPEGWSTMGALDVGDVVFDEHGEPCEVLATSDVMHDRPCFDVEFSDGERIVSDAEHLWTVDELARGYEQVTITTAEMAERVSPRADGARNFRIQVAGELNLPDADLPIDPYVLGVWLGDGERGAGRITSADEELVEFVRDAGYEVHRRAGSYRWAVHGLVRDLDAAGVRYAKHVPAVFLRAGVKQRWALLQGLMDTDGYVDRSGSCEFCTTAPSLRDGVSELLTTLGVKHRVTEARAKIYGRDCGPKWRVTFAGFEDAPPVRLSRKAERLIRRSTRVHGRSGQRSATRQVVAVRPTPSVSVRCIRVSSPSSLFLVGRKMVPTHNSPFAAVVALAELVGPSVFGGFDAAGEPVGRAPEAPWVQIAAVSEDQTQNTYSALHAMLADSPLVDLAKIDLGVTRTVLRGRPGKIEMVTASAGSREGQPITAAIMDETHLWTRQNGGRRLARTIQRNASPMGGRVLATTNAYDPGAESVAEQVEAAAAATPGILVYGPQYEAKVDDVANEAQLRVGLERAYRDAPWVDVSRVLADCLDPDMPAEDVRRFHLNVNEAAGSVLCQAATFSADELPPGSPVALGFDGSKSWDATAVVAVHMVSGVAHLLGYWERPQGLPRGAQWEVPRVEVGEVLEVAFSRFQVARMKADPSYWHDELAGWQQRWDRDVVDRMAVGSLSVVSDAVEGAQEALRNGGLTLSSAPEAAVLRAQAARARVPRRQMGARVLRGLAKPEDGGRIDAAAALVYAHAARLDALSKGWTAPVDREAVVLWG